jgi:hypothetical protein
VGVQPAVHAPRALHQRDAGDAVRERSAGWSRPTCTARGTTGSARSGRTCDRCGCAWPTGRSSSAGRARAGAVLGDGRRDGPDRAHPRGRVSDAEDPDAVDPGGEPAHRRHRSVHRRAEAGRASTGRSAVGWIDCLSRGKRMGRGILDYGRWAEPQEGGRPLPFTPQADAAVRTFRAARSTASRPGRSTRCGTGSTSQRARAGCATRTHSSIRSTRSCTGTAIYGRRGFTQYQCVLPDSAGKGAARRFLELLTKRGGASFLCVIKDCGAPRGRGCCRSCGRGSRSRSTSRCATTPSAGRHAQRAGDRGGRADLPRQGRVHPPRALRGDGPAAARIQAVRDRWDPADDPLGAVGAGARRPAMMRDRPKRLVEEHHEHTAAG